MTNLEFNTIRTLRHNVNLSIQILKENIDFSDLTARLREIEYSLKDLFLEQMRNQMFEENLELGTDLESSL